MAVPILFAFALLARITNGIMIVANSMRVLLACIEGRLGGMLRNSMAGPNADEGGRGEEEKKKGGLEKGRV